MYCNYYEIGKCVIRVTSKCKFDNNIELFRGVPAPCSISIEHHYNKAPFIFKMGETVFKSEEWLVKKYDTMYSYFYKPYKIKAITNTNHTEWKIYAPKGITNSVQSNLGLFYSDQVIIYPWLIKNNGIYLHGNALHKNGKCVLLIGDSGSGKSTMSRMLEEDGWTLLCDDRILIMDNMAHGHWCHGSYNKVARGSFKINYIATVNQAKTTKIKPCQSGVHEFMKNNVHCLHLNKEYALEIFGGLVVSGVKFIDIYFNLSGDVKNLLTSL